MSRGYFVTGTDTGVGKTWVTVALMRYFRRLEMRVAGMKPVASGCSWVDGRLKNGDALLIQANCNAAFDYDLINPYAYEAAVSPHIAGLENPARLSVIQANYEQLISGSDQIIVEGAGGWYSPLTKQLDNAGLALALNLPVILVVAIRLGCINQARLSFQAISQSSARCAGWVALCIDPKMPAREANIRFLQEVLDAPLLGVVPFMEHSDFDACAKLISIK